MDTTIHKPASALRASGDEAPIYPGYSTPDKKRKLPVLVDTTSNYESNGTSKIYRPRSHTTSTEGRRSATSRRSGTRKPKKSKRFVRGVIGCVIFIAIAVVVAAIVFVLLGDIMPKTPPPAPTQATDPDMLVRGKLTLENLVFQDDLLDPSSALFKEYRDAICIMIVDSLEDELPAKECDVLEMSPGSVNASWVIALTSTNNLLPEMLQFKVEVAINKWLKSSSQFSGRVGSVYKDACALMDASEKPCEQICLDVTSSTHPKCKCEKGYKLGSDGRRCIDPCNKERDWSKIDAESVTGPIDLQSRLAKVMEVGPFNASCAIGMCVRAEYWCDGIMDCPDRSDENSCQTGGSSGITCPVGWFKCADNSGCVPSQYVCDLLPDCPDESDEGFDCDCPPPESKLRQILPSSLFNKDSGSPSRATNAYGSGADPFDWKRCDTSGLCYWSLFACDGVANCLDGSDERQSAC